MSDNDYKLLNEGLQSMDSNMYKNDGYGSPMGGEEGGLSRSPPPPYGVNTTQQPYGMISSPVNPMMFQQQQQPPQVSPPQQIVHVVSQPQQIMGPTSVGQDPIRLQCPSCREFIKSKIDRKTICKTHLCACLLFIFFCWPCMCIPYCSSSCRDANHTCPNCGHYLGTYKA